MTLDPLYMNLVPTIYIYIRIARVELMYNLSNLVPLSTL